MRDDTQRRVRGKVLTSVLQVLVGRVRRWLRVIEDRVMVEMALLRLAYDLWDRNGWWKMTTTTKQQTSTHQSNEFLQHQIIQMPTVRGHARI